MLPWVRHGLICSACIELIARSEAAGNTTEHDPATGRPNLRVLYVETKRVGPTELFRELGRLEKTYREVQGLPQRECHV